MVLFVSITYLLACNQKIINHFLLEKERKHNIYKNITIIKILNIKEINTSMLIL
jgi:hypothetical protein